MPERRDADGRRPPLARPAEQRTSDQSTQSASGLSGGVPPELREDVVARDDRGVDDTPRRYDADLDDEPE